MRRELGRRMAVRSPAERNEIALASQPARDNDEGQKCYDCLERPKKGKNRFDCAGNSFEAGGTAIHNSHY
jgi:hypothetical protein